MTRIKLSFAWLRNCFLRGILPFGWFLASLNAKEIPRVAPGDVGMSAGKLDEASRVVQGFVDKRRIAGAITVVARKGKIVQLKTHGMMDIERRKPMQEDAIFRIFSMSKAIVSTAALMLLEEGRFQPGDPVKKYLPQFSRLKVYSKDGKPTPAKNDMSVADLMLHTSGLSYGFVGNTLVEKTYRQKGFPMSSRNLDAFVEELSKVPLRHEPGKKWNYSVSTDVLGKLVEVWSGKTLDEFLRKRIFEPLDMRDTGFHVPADKVDRFTANYNSNQLGRLKVIDDPRKSGYLKEPTLFSGGGGLVSTARDYLRFLVMIQQGGILHGTRILKPETVRKMTSNQLPDQLMPIQIGQPPRAGVGFGYGFSVRTKMTAWDPGGKVGEFGWGGAASTHYWIHPGDELVVLTLEQTMPYTFFTEWGIKKLIYQAIKR